MTGPAVQPAMPRCRPATERCLGATRRPETAGQPAVRAEQGSETEVLILQDVPEFPAAGSGAGGSLAPRLQTSLSTKPPLILRHFQAQSRSNPSDTSIESQDP